MTSGKMSQSVMAMIKSSGGRPPNPPVRRSRTGTDLKSGCSKLLTAFPLAFPQFIPWYSDKLFSYSPPPRSFPQVLAVWSVAGPLRRQRRPRDPHVLRTLPHHPWLLRRRGGGAPEQAPRRSHPLTARVQVDIALLPQVVPDLRAPAPPPATPRRHGRRKNPNIIATAISFQKKRAYEDILSKLSKLFSLFLTSLLTS